MMGLVFTGMAALIAFIIALPFAAKAFAPPLPGQEQQKTLQLYKAQLKNIDRDVDAGLLSKADAKEYRLEIERRVLLEGETKKAASGKGKKSLFAMVIPFALVLALSGFAYYKLGQPGFFPPTRPISVPELVPADGGPSLNELIGDLKTYLEENPGNQEGWFRLANVSMQIRAFRDAANAFGQAALLETENDVVAADLFARQAEAFVFLSEGLVSPAADWAIVQSLQNDPAQPLARYYKGLGLFQAQEPEQALLVWQGLASDLPPDTPWLPSLVSQINQAKRLMGVQ